MNRLRRNRGKIEQTVATIVIIIGIFGFLSLCILIPSAVLAIPFYVTNKADSFFSALSLGVLTLSTILFIPCVIVSFYSLFLDMVHNTQKGL